MLKILNVYEQKEKEKKKEIKKDRKGKKGGTKHQTDNHFKKNILIFVSLKKQKRKKRKNAKLFLWQRPHEVFVAVPGSQIK